MKMYDISLEVKDDGDVFISQHVVGTSGHIIILGKDQVPVMIEWLNQAIKNQSEK